MSRGDLDYGWEKAEQQPSMTKAPAGAHLGSLLVGVLQTAQMGVRQHNFVESSGCRWDKKKTRLIEAHPATVLKWIDWDCGNDDQKALHFQ